MKIEIVDKYSLQRPEILEGAWKGMDYSEIMQLMAQIRSSPKLWPTSGFTPYHAKYIDLSCFTKGRLIELFVTRTTSAIYLATNPGMYLLDGGGAVLGFLLSTKAVILNDEKKAREWLNIQFSCVGGVEPGSVMTPLSHMCRYILPIGIDNILAKEILYYTDKFFLKKKRDHFEYQQYCLFGLEIVKVQGKLFFSGVNVVDFDSIESICSFPYYVEFFREGKRNIGMIL